MRKILSVVAAAAILGAANTAFAAEAPHLSAELDDGAMHRDQAGVETHEAEHHVLHAAAHVGRPGRVLRLLDVVPVPVKLTTWAAWSSNGMATTPG